MVGSARGRAYGARWLRTPRAAVLACTFLASSATLRAQDAPLIAQLGAAGPEQVVVQLVLNQEKKGEYFVAVVEGKFLARTQDLLAAGVPVAGARTMVTGGNEYVWIDSIPGVQASFDEGATLVGRDAAGAEILSQKLEVRYVLAGSGKPLSFAIPKEVCARLATLDVTARASQLTLSRQLAITRAGCE